jgi:hypothetical protein
VFLPGVHGLWLAWKENVVGSVTLDYAVPELTFMNIYKDMKKEA